MIYQLTAPSAPPASFRVASDAGYLSALLTAIVLYATQHGVEQSAVVAKRVAA